MGIEGPPSQEKYFPVGFYLDKGISEAKKCKKDRIFLLVVARVNRVVEKVLARFCLSASFSHSFLKVCVQH